MRRLPRVLSPAMVLLLVWGVAVPGCAARGPGSAIPTPAAEFARAEALLLEGCYRCLEEAHRILAGLGDWPGARARAFDAAALLAARQREIGLRGPDHLAVARSEAPSPPDSRATLVLGVIEALPWPPVASSPDERDAALVGHAHLAPRVAEWHQALASHGPGDLVARYLLWSLRCTWPYTVPEPEAATEGPENGPALLRYRMLTCASDPTDDLAALQQDVRRFDEIDLWLGDLAMRAGTLLTAERHYARVLMALPPVLPAAHGLARIHVMLEEYEASLPEYDAVLAAVPDQQDSLLGKARALSHLGRHHDALPLLDRLIQAGTWLLGDAHYWRGWNLWRLGDLDAAESEADAALRLMVNARVHVLAGGVAAARDDWARAVREFETALPLDESDCEISLSLATARGHRREWSDAAPHFMRAASCLVESQERLERRLEEIGAAPMSPERRVRFDARTRAAAARARTQEGLARFNAAVALVNAGRGDEAATWARDAAAWPEWHERAAAILRRVEQ